MGRRSDGGDLEVIAVEVEGDEPAPVLSHPARRERRRAVLALGVVVLAGLVVGGVLLATDRARSSPPRATTSTLPAHPTIQEVNSRGSVQRSILINAMGDKILTRPVTATHGAGPIGVIALAPPDAGHTGVLAVSGTTLLAQGVDESGDGRDGTWAFPTQGRAPGVFLGVSTAFCPSIDGQAWLTDGTTVRRVAVSDASMLDGPYPLDGRLVASVGAGLLLQRGPAVVWWLPGSPGETRMVGTGTALDGRFEYILWQATDGQLDLTDPNTGHVTPTAISVRPGQAIAAGVLSPNFVRVAVVVGTALTIGDALLGGRRITVATAGPVGDVAWLDDDTLLVRVGPTGLVAVDASTGVIVHEPDLGYGSRGLAVVHSPPG